MSSPTGPVTHGTKARKTITVNDRSHSIYIPYKDARIFTHLVEELANYKRSYNATKKAYKVL